MTPLEQSIWRRDRATQAALNFAGQTISSADGTHALLIECIADAMKDAEAREREVRVARNLDLDHEILYLSDWAATFADSWKHLLTEEQYNAMGQQFADEAGMYASDQVEAERELCARVAEVDGRGLSSKTIADLIRARSNAE
jgi:hypothetical protein